MLIKKWLIFGLILVSVLSVEWYEQGNPKFLNSDEYETAIKKDTTSYKFMKFFTPYCRYCRFLKTVIEEIKSQHHRDDVIFYDFNCQAYPSKCSQLGIYAYPHVIVYSPEGQEINSLHGFSQKPIVLDFMNNAMPVRPKLQQVKIQQKKQPNVDPILVQPPKQQPPKVQPPKVQQPKVQNPKIQSPKVQQPKIQKPKVQQKPQQKIKQIQEDKPEVPTDINQAQEKQIEKSVQKNVLQGTINASVEKVSQKSGLLKLMFYLMVGLFGGYYFHQIMKKNDENNQLSENKVSQQKNIFEGEIKNDKSNQNLDEQCNLVEIKDEDL